MQITAFAPASSACPNSASIVSGWNSGVSTTVSVTSGMPWSGLVTALCSYPEMMTRLPGFTSVLMAMFSP